MINQNDINFTMICHRNFATKWHSVFEDKDLKLSKETITNKTVCGYGVANQKSFYFIKNDDREFLSIEDLVNAYNEKFKFEYENPDQEVIYKRIIKKKIIMGTFGIRSKKRQSQINDGAITYIMKMYDNSKLRAKERLFEPKDLATKFAMWFAVNWEWHDDTEKGTKYLSIYDGKTVKTIGEIYDNWLLNDI